MADELVRRDAATRVVFAGTPRGLETRLVPQAGYALELLPILPLNAIGAPANGAGVCRAAVGAGARRGARPPPAPAAVLGVGGYAGGPVDAARRAPRGAHGDPRAEREARLHEPRPEAVRGEGRLRATRRLAAYFGAKGVLTGNPVRGGFASLPRQDHRPPLTLLVFGGSQGSRVLNEALVAALPHLPGAERLRIVHQTGAAMHAGDRHGATRRRAARPRSLPFLDDMERRFAEADLVSRAAAPRPARS